nr:hypothetical protein [Nanoarchaeota archaeon]
MSNKCLTKEMFLRGKVNLKEPEILSERNASYYERYASHLTKSDVKSLCEILQHQSNEIFTEKHGMEI